MDYTYWEFDVANVLVVHTQSWLFMVKWGGGNLNFLFPQSNLTSVLQVLAIKFITFVIEFVTLAIELISLAIEFVVLAIEFVPFAVEFITLAIEFVALA